MQTGRLLHGRYRLVAPIARGGMAEVWEGVDDVLTRPIAVKLLHPHLAADAGFEERFRREAIAAARLAHRNVVATFDTGEDEGVAFIVMELVPGRTLRQLLVDEGGVLPPWLAREVGVQVADALHHAHESGLVHRDVKPANILVRVDEGGPVEVKVADFGIARAAAQDGADLTQPGALMGTAKYLSPEQVEGGEPTPRSDVYALGVVLYEVLTGRPPFAADSEVATAMAHVHTEPRRPRQVRPGIPRSLEEVVCRAMAKDPAVRYASAADLAGALRGLDLGDDDAVPSIVHDPTPPSGLAPTFRQTERSWLVPAAVIVGVAVTLVVVGLVLRSADVAPSLLGGGDRDGAGTNGAGTPVELSASRSFDPQGRPPTENDDDVGAVRDADPATTWRTDRYNTVGFGGLKDGVGVVVELAAEVAVRRVRVSSGTSGWSGQVFVAAAAGPALADWGEPATPVQDGIAGSATFELPEARRGRAVLVWFTRLGDDRRVEVAEITVEQ